jgi:hypothetical protein
MAEKFDLKTQIKTPEDNTVSGETSAQKIAVGACPYSQLIRVWRCAKVEYS